MRKILLLFLAPILFSYHVSAQKTEPVEIEDEWHDPYQEGFNPSTAAEMLNALKKAKQKSSQKTQATPVFESFIEKGPTNYPGRINTVLVDHENGIYLAGTSTGGLWRFEPDRTVLGQSQTNTTKWYKLNDYALSLSVVKIVQSTVDPLTIYYATGDGEAGSGAGIFKSTDGGVSFSQLAATDPASFPDFARIYSMEINPFTDDLYVGIYGKAYVSKDGGSTFQEIFNASGSGAVESISFNASEAVLLSSNNKGIYRSPDGSAGSFTQLTNGIKHTPDGTSEFYYLKISACASQRDVIYAMVSGPSSVQYLDGIYKTTNGDDSWTKVNDPKSTVSFSMPYRAFVISVKPTDPDMLIAAGVTAASSSDGGMTWKYIMNIGIDHSSVLWEKDSSSVYFTCDHGMYFHLNDTLMDTWGNRVDMTNDGLNNLQCYYGDYFVKGDGVLYGAQDNQSCVMRNNSSLAYWFAGGDGFNVFTHKQDSNVVYGSLQYGSLYRCDTITPAAPYVNPKGTVSILGSLDANADGSVDEGHGFYTQFLVSEANSDHLFFPTNQTIYRSKDRGKNWTPITGSLSLSNCRLAYDEQSVPTLYYARQYGLFRIKDALNTGVAVPEELSLGLTFYDYVKKIEMDPNDPNVLYYINSNNNSSSPTYLYRIDDVGGNTPVKTDISGDLSAFVNDIAVYPGNSNIIIAGTNIGLFYTNNGGSTWALIEEFPYVKVNDIKFRPSDKKLYIFTYGRGVWIAELKPDIVNSVTGPNAVAAEREVKVYPSPAREYIKVKAGDEMEVFVMNLNGKICRHVKAYKNESPILINDLAPGVYVVKFYDKTGWRYETLVKN